MKRQQRQDVRMEKTVGEISEHRVERLVYVFAEVDIALLEGKQFYC